MVLRQTLLDLRSMAEQDGGKEGPYNKSQRDVPVCLP